MAVRIIPPTNFQYHTLRKITSPEDAENGREIYCGYAPAESVLPLPTDENVRDYLLEAQGRLRNRKTNVHREMFETLKNNPQNFSVLNGGVTIVAHAVQVDDKSRIVKLTRASIINGSQTQGVLGEWLAEQKRHGETPFPVHVKFELIVTDSEDVIAATSISRNFQNQVMPISIVGRLGYLDEINESFKKESGGAFELRTKETEFPGDEIVPTEKLLQVITALVPADLWHRKGEVKNYAYSAKAKCLREFQKVYEAANKGKRPDGDEPLTPEERKAFKKLYRFYVEIAWEAWSLYLRWKEHPGFKGTRIRKEEAVIREGGEVKEVNDGIVFPIIAALSVFASNESGKWTIAMPRQFSEKELAEQAAEAFMEIANSHPWDMGKSKACYAYLFRLTSFFKKHAPSLAAVDA
jgi:hypothetical protein